MPTEILDADLFVKISERAEVCRVLRQGDEVKLKLRTPGRLYTMKVQSSRADGLLKTLGCKVEELTKEKKRKGQRDETASPRETQEEE